MDEPLQQTGDLQIQVAELQARNENLVRVLEDFIHQIKAPIFGAYTRANAAKDNAMTLEELRREMRIVCALCGRARKTSMNIGVFVSLSQGTSFHPQLTNLSQESLIELLTEAAADCHLLTNPDCNLKWNIDRESFAALRSLNVQADQDLLEQAVRNVIDNAMKYSYHHGQIRIYGGLTKKGQFHITVENKGIPINPVEVAHVAKRGWRSEHATHSTGEGTGLGLWIVDNIMKAHGGELVVVPTTAEGLTAVKLAFPVR